MRCGVIDLGSCTFHALVADVDTHGVRHVVFERGVVLRVGDHTDGADEVSELVRQRCVHAVHELLARAQERSAVPVRVIATGTLRDTPAGRRFVSDASARLGITIDVLSEHEEARLTWLGVSTELAESHGRLAVLDLGGGSFEIAAGTTAPAYTHSMPLGVLRLRHLSTAGLRDTIEQLTTHAVDELAAFRPETLALSSGTARALLRVARRLGIVADRQRHVPNAAFLELARRLPQQSHAALLDLGVDRSRLDTIAAGAAMFAAVLARLQRPVVYVARSGLREGALVEHMRRAPACRAVAAPTFATA